MKRDGLEQTLIKSNIIKCILEENEPVSEPDIRKKLEEKNILKDQSTINRHLHYLNNFEFIKLIPPIKAGLRNKWDITKTRHLKNIKIYFKDNKPFEKIELNTYEKSIMIVLYESNLTVKDLDGFFYFTSLRLSPSLFDKCLDIRIKELFNRACENISKEEIIPKSSETSFLVRCIETLDIINPEQSREIQNRMNQKLTEEKIENHHKRSFELSFMLKFINEFYRIRSSDWVLKHFLDHDKLDGVASPEEQEFVEKSELNHIKYFLSFKNTNDFSLDIGEERLYKDYILNDLKLACTVMAKHKQPSVINKEECDDADKIYQSLMRFYYSSFESKENPILKDINNLFDSSQIFDLTYSQDECNK